MTIREREDTSIQVIRNINMAKGVLQRRNTCDGFIPSARNHSNNNNNNNGSPNTVSSLSRRSFRILTPRNEKREASSEKQREIKQTSGGLGSPDTGRRNMSVSRVAEAFHELQQKLITRATRHNDENDCASSKTSNALLKFELSKKNSQVSKKINMFNKSTKSHTRKEHNKDTNSEVYIESKRCRDEGGNMNKKLKHDDVTCDVITPSMTHGQNKNIIIGNGVSVGGHKHVISEEEMLFIRKRKAIGRSNSAMIPLRELVMTREVANSRRSLSFSLIPEDETLTLLEAVERRLNLSKETNLCDTVL